MGFCRLEDTFHDEPKWHRIGAQLDIFWVTAAGHVACLYSWAARHAKDGDLRDFEVADLERAMGWNGAPGALVDALTSKRVCILEKARSGLIIHRYMERAETYKAAQKKRRQRDKPGTDDEVVPGQDGDSPGNVPREREEREEREERKEGGDPARETREEPPPPATDSLFEIAASQIPIRDAQALVEHYDHEVRAKRGQVRAGVVPPMAYHQARVILAHAGRDIELAKRVVTAYVHSDHEWWKRKRWMLSLLADPKDFEHAERLAAKGAASRVAAAERVAQPDIDAKREAERVESMSPAERVAHLRVAAAAMRKLNPSSSKAAELDAQANDEESRMADSES